jgi:hypothetical protein
MQNQIPFNIKCNGLDSIWLKRAIILFTILWIGTPRIILAQSYQNDFLNIGIGARGQALMGARIASTDDVFSTYWNPAGLTQIKKPLEIGAMHAEWFTGIVKHDYLGVAKQLDTTRRSVGALSIIRSGVDNIPNTLNLYDPNGAINYDNITEFSYVSYGIFASYAQAILQTNWNIGANTKVLFSQAGPFGRALGIGIDAGLTYRNKRLMFGIMARDITTTYNRWRYTFTDEQQQVLVQTGNELIGASSEITRPSLLPSLAWKQPYKDYTFQAEVMAHFTFDGQRNVLLSSSWLNISPAMGLEAGYKNRIFLRGGLGNFQRIRPVGQPDNIAWNMRPAFGIGLYFGSVKIDYALTNVGNTSNNRYSHIFSAIVSLSPRKSN